MAAPRNFRTAMRGFNREDVVHYLEYLNSKHQTEVNQLNADIEALQSALSKRAPLDDPGKIAQLQNTVQELEARLAASEPAVQELQARLAESEEAKRSLEEALAAAREENRVQGEKAAGTDSENRSLADKLAALEAENQSLVKKLAAAESDKQALTARCGDLERKKPAETPVSTHNELSAYRRAQSIEDESRVRAELVYYQTNGVLSKAMTKVDVVSGEITEIADQALKELTRLQLAVSESKQTLQEAASMMKAIRPNN